MAKKLKACLYMKDDEYFLLPADGAARQLSIDEVRKFILSFDEAPYSEILPQDITPPEPPLAEIDASGQLILSSSLLLLNLFQCRYISAIDFAEQHDKARALIYRFCRNGRIPGAVLRDRRWWIPEGTSYPTLEKRGRKVPLPDAK